MSISRLPLDITLSICDRLSLKRLIQLRSTNRLLRSDCQDIYEQKLADFQMRFQKALRTFEDASIPYMESHAILSSPPYEIILHHVENEDEEESEFVSRYFTVSKNSEVIYESPEFPIYKRKFPTIWVKSFSKSSWERFVHSVQHALIQYEMDDFVITT